VDWSLLKDTTIVVGEKLTVIGKVTPASFVKKENFVLESSDEAVATADSEVSGAWITIVVTGLSPGEATISVTMSSIEKSESVKVTVIDHEPCNCEPCNCETCEECEECNCEPCNCEECEVCEECETCEECEDCGKCEECIEIYTVTFISDGKTVFESLFTAGSILAEPKLAPRDGYTFDGWYKDDNSWNFASDAVTANVTLHAKWSVIIPDVYVVGRVGNFAVLWKNGVRQNLNDGSTYARAYSVFVSGNDVYIAGEESARPMLWKNGEAQAFSDIGAEDRANSVFVSGNDVCYSLEKRKSRIFN
jgi:uncharacterized repeat protein (TIGR02543 family)